MIIFFVPKGREDVAQYIVQEWQPEVRIADNSEAKDLGWWFSTRIQIMYFSGVKQYIEHAVSMEAAHAGTLYVMEKFKNPDSEITIEDCMPKSKRKH